MRLSHLAIAFAAAAQFSIPAWAAEQRYSVTDFDRIQVSGPYEVVLTSGRAAAARATGSRAALDDLSVEVNDGTLHIQRSANAWSNGGESGGPVTVFVSTEAIRGAVMSGSGSLSMDKVSGMRVAVTLSGSGHLTASAVDADTLSVGLIGSGSMTLAGKAHILRLEAHGSGGVEGSHLVAGDATIAADSAGPISLVATSTAKITGTAPGDVTVTGSASCTVKQLGSGQIRCGRSGG